MGLNETTTPDNNGSYDDLDAWVEATVAGLDCALAQAGVRLPPAELRELARQREQSGPSRLAQPPVAHANNNREPLGRQVTRLSDLFAGMLLAPSDPNANAVPHHPPSQVDGFASAPLYGAASASAEQPVPPHAAAARTMAEVILLPHLLVRCAEHMQRNDIAPTAALIQDMRLMLSRVGTGCGIGKVATHFVDALKRRLCYPPNPGSSDVVMEYWVFYFYRQFYVACPYLKFTHFVANQAILQALAGHDRVHIVDLNLLHGLQWPALIQALARRPGGPPAVRFTGISPPAPDERGNAREVGAWLTQLARSLGVDFTFRRLMTNKVENVLYRVDASPGREAVVVNSVMHLHRLLGDPEETDQHQPIDSVLSWIRRQRPVIVTIVEQDANHNTSRFVDRFKEALSYYSCMFEALVGGREPPQTGMMTAAEAYFRREICNIVCCEEDARVERHEPLARWQWRMTRAGFRPARLGSLTFDQARMQLMLLSGIGDYTIREADGCLTLGWRGRPLISTSAWMADFSSPTYPSGVKNNVANFNIYRRE